MDLQVQSELRRYPEVRAEPQRRIRGHRRLGGRAPIPGSGGQKVVGGDGADAQEQETEGGRQDRGRGPPRQRPTEEPSHLSPGTPPHFDKNSETTRLRVVSEVLVGE